MYGSELQLDEKDEIIESLRKELKITRMIAQSHGEIVEENAALRADITKLETILEPFLMALKEYYAEVER
ncbi:hypothetical protein M0R04_11630 [Candidatus Dojkabacteria bacterium]|jgi:hypothetical protein|nr:hypothetical protein [Candidatus Dojkabacteria bacterium]